MTIKKPQQNDPRIGQFMARTVYTANIFAQDEYEGLAPASEKASKNPEEIISKIRKHYDHIISWMKTVLDNIQSENETNNDSSSLNIWITFWQEWWDNIKQVSKDDFRPFLRYYQNQS